MSTGVVYELTFPNGKRYVGQTTGLKRRMTEHARCDKAADGHAVKRAIRKYGWLNVKVSVLEEGIERALLGERERHWIAERKSMVHEWGYNLTEGGDAQPMDHPVVQAWHQQQIKVAMNRDDVRFKKRALWNSESHMEMMQEARLNFASAEKRRLAFAKKREAKVARMGVEEGKKFMRRVRFVLWNNSRCRSSVTDGQQADAMAFWEREWARYERLYWRSPPLASSAPHKREGVSDSEEEGYAWWGAGVRRTEISPTAEPRADAGCESDEEGYAWWDAGVRRAL